MNADFQNEPRDEPRDEQMNRSHINPVRTISTIWMSWMATVMSVTASASSREPILCSGETLIRDRALFKTQRGEAIPGFTRMLQSADFFLTQAALTVTSKSMIPLSGSKNDYLSISMYHWPDPSKAEGLPWLYHDGQVNRERMKLSQDSDSLGQTMSRIRVLSTAYTITQDERYAKKTIELVRAWFLEPKMRMNPNLNFAQMIPGAGPFKSYGVIEGVTLVQTLDSLRFLEASPEWTAADSQGIRKWMTDYRDWLKNSPVGKVEATTLNNHKSGYDYQLASIESYLGNQDAVRRIVEASKADLFPQIASDGSLPQEIARTRPLHYTVYNLNAMTGLAELGKKVGINLWQYETADHRSIKRAVDYILPCVTAGGSCPFKSEPVQQNGAQSPQGGVEAFQPQNALQILLRADSEFSGHPYVAAAANLQSKVKEQPIDAQIWCEPPLYTAPASRSERSIRRSFSGPLLLPAAMTS
ncbi:MAG: alginate lyase family protein [Methylotenera sp.]|nr:alginate lyase family protein [Oligoflexia bacterium]